MDEIHYSLQIVRKLEQDHQQLNEWSIPAPLQALFGKMFTKLNVALSLITTGPAIVMLFKQGKIKEAMIEGLKAIGWMLPYGIAFMSAYELGKYFMENQDEIMQFIDDFINENTSDDVAETPKLSDDQLAAIKKLVTQLENGPDKNHPEVQKVLNLYYKKYGKS